LFSPFNAASKFPTSGSLSFNFTLNNIFMKLFYHPTSEIWDRSNSLLMWLTVLSLYIFINFSMFLENGFFYNIVCISLELIEWKKVLNG
jgi:hypothetical protein